MLKPWIQTCADIHTEYCPCLLADTNHCTFCSRLQGKDFCDCNWSGTCIFYEKYWQDKIRAENHPVERSAEECAIVRQEQIGNRTYRLEFAVSQSLADKLNRPGAFVFLRRVSDPPHSHFPVGVMNIAARRVTVVVEAVGAKSSRFLLNRDERIQVRGPYYNGVLGSLWFDSLKGGRVALLAGGIGQAPSAPILRRLLGNGNRVDAIVAPGKTGTLFLQQEICHENLIFHPTESLRAEGFSLLKKFLREKVDLLVSAGPDAQHAGIIGVLRDAGVNVPMAATNNAVICCGEGLCGSCCQLTQDNKTVKMCKTQINYQEIMQE